MIKYSTKLIIILFFLHLLIVTEVYAQGARRFSSGGSQIISEGNDIGESSEEIRLFDRRFDTDNTEPVNQIDMTTSNNPNNDNHSTENNPYKEIMVAVAGLVAAIAGMKFNLSKIKEAIPNKNGLFIPKESREEMLDLINNSSKSQYIADDEGFVYKDTNANENPNGTTENSDIIDGLITEDRLTVLGNDNKVSKVDENGNIVSESIDKSLTVGKEETDQAVILDLNKMKEENISKDEQGNILLKELNKAYDNVSKDEKVYSVRDYDSSHATYVVPNIEEKLKVLEGEFTYKAYPFEIFALDVSTRASTEHAIEAAKEFCEKQGYRLTDGTYTEEEWDYIYNVFEEEYGSSFSTIKPGLDYMKNYYYENSANTSSSGSGSSSNDNSTNSSEPSITKIDDNVWEYRNAQGYVFEITNDETGEVMGRKTLKYVNGKYTYIDAEDGVSYSAKIYPPTEENNEEASDENTNQMNNDAQTIKFDIDTRDNSIKLWELLDQDKLEYGDYIVEGDKGEHIEYLQRLLNDLEFRDGEINGEYGGKTINAVKAFQEEIGIKANGIIDNKTLKAIQTAFAYRDYNETYVDKVKEVLENEDGGAVDFSTPPPEAGVYEEPEIVSEYDNDTEYKWKYRYAKGKKANIIDKSSGKIIGSTILKYNEGQLTYKKENESSSYDLDIVENDDPNYQKWIFPSKQDDEKNIVVLEHNNLNGKNIKLFDENTSDVIYEGNITDDTGRIATVVDSLNGDIGDTSQYKLSYNEPEEGEFDGQLPIIRNFYVNEDSDDIEIEPGKTIPIRAEAINSSNIEILARKFTENIYGEREYYDAEVIGSYINDAEEFNLWDKHTFLEEGNYQVYVVGYNEQSDGERYDTSYDIDVRVKKPINNISDLIDRIGKNLKEMGDEATEYLDSMTLEDWLDGLQTTLDVAGLVPVLGEAADLSNAAIYYVRGKDIEALLSIGAMVPIAGQGSTGLKLTKKGVNALKRLKNANKIIKVSSKVIQKVKYYLNNKLDSLFEIVQETEDKGRTIFYKLRSGESVYIRKSDLTEGQKTHSLIGCFTGDTLVNTKNGLKRIDQIQEGEYVLSREEKTGVTAYKKVLYVYKKSINEFVHLNFGTEVVKTTKTHLFMLDSGDWKSSENLKVGDKIQTNEGTVKEVVEIKVVTHEKPIGIYNLNVEDYHTYFVGNGSYWVHNDCSAKMADDARDAGKALTNLLKSFDDISKYPKELWGKSADEVAEILGEGWTRGIYGSSGNGWKFTKGDQSVFYHPGGGIHEGSYYGFSSGKLGKNKIVDSDYKAIPGDKATIIKIDE